MLRKTAAQSINQGHLKNVQRCRRAKVSPLVFENGGRRSTDNCLAQSNDLKACRCCDVHGLPHVIAERMALPATLTDLTRLPGSLQLRRRNSAPRRRTIGAPLKVRILWHFLWLPHTKAFDQASSSLCFNQDCMANFFAQANPRGGLNDSAKLFARFALTQVAVVLTSLTAPIAEYRST